MEVEFLFARALSAAGEKTCTVVNSSSRKCEKVHVGRVRGDGRVGSVKGSAGGGVVRYMIVRIERRTPSITLASEVPSVFM